MKLEDKDKYKTGCANLISDTSKRLAEYSVELEKLAERYDKDPDPDILSLALSSIRNCFGNIRFDLFPIRQERDRKNNEN